MKLIDICPTCEGSGHIGNKKGEVEICPECGGTGAIEDKPKVLKF